MRGREGGVEHLFDCWGLEGEWRVGLGAGHWGLCKQQGGPVQHSAVMYKCEHECAIMCGRADLQVPCLKAGLTENRLRYECRAYQLWTEGGAATTARGLLWRLWGHPFSSLPHYTLGPYNLYWETSSTGMLTMGWVGRMREPRMSFVSFDSSAGLKKGLFAEECSVCGLGEAGRHGACLIGWAWL